jgi:hypothetical protein
MARTYLGKRKDLGGTSRVYRAPGAFEVDEMEGTSGTRRRIFFEDIFLVTYHREVGGVFTFVVGVLCALFLVAIGNALVDGFRNPASGGLNAAGIIAAVTAPFFIIFFNRVIRKMDVITIFGRHGKARIEFEWRKTKARTVFQETCKAARDSRPAVRRVRTETLQEPPSSFQSEDGPGPDPTTS